MMLPLGDGSLDPDEMGSCLLSSFGALMVGIGAVSPCLSSPWFPGVGFRMEWRDGRAWPWSVTARSRYVVGDLGDLGPDLERDV